MDGGNSPVITSPWSQQQQPNTPISGKSRRAWFTFSPHKVVLPKQDDEEDLPVLQLTHFGKKVMVCFNKIKLGKSKTCRLSIENPFDYPQELVVEKFPHKKGFTIPEDRWAFDEKENRILPITWTPSEGGNVRELVTFKCDGAFRLQVILLGTAEDKPQGKRRRGTLLVKKNNGNVTKAPGKVGAKRPQQVNPSNATKIFQQPRVGQKSATNPKQKFTLKQENEIFGKENIPTKKDQNMLKEVLNPARQTMIITKKPVVSPKRSPLQERRSLSPFQCMDSSLVEITNTTSPDTEHHTKRSTLSLCDGMSPLLQTSFVYCGDLDKSHLADFTAEEVFNDSLEVACQQDPSKTVTKPQIVVGETVDDKTYVKRLSKEAQATIIKGKAPSLTPPSRRQSRRTLFGETLRIAPNVCDKTTDVRDPSKVCKNTNTPLDNVEVNSDQVVCETNANPCLSDELDTLDIQTSSTMLSQITLPNESQLIPIHESTARKKLKGRRLSSSSETTSMMKDKPEEFKAPLPPISPVELVLQVSEPDAGLFPVHQSVVTKNLSNKRKSDPKKVLQDITSSKRKSDPKNVQDFANNKRKSDPKIVRDFASNKKLKPSEKTAPVSKQPQMTRKQPVSATAPSKVVKNDAKTAASKVIKNESKKIAAVGKKQTNTVSANATKSSGTSEPNRGMTRTMMLRRAAAGATTNTSKSKPAKTTKRPMKGVPMSKLNLVKPNKTALPRHPMPYAAKNMFYDERWMEKQEQGFSRWLNYVLTPDEDCPTDPSCKATKIDAGALFVEANQQITVALAPSREDLSLRAYTARRKLNRLRRAACLLFQSEPVVRVIQKVEYEVERGGLKIRMDRKIHADYGIKQKLLNMFLSYNPLWLRIGLETVYGEILPIQSNTDILGLSRFVVQRLLWNPDIAQKYVHPTVPGLYGPGYEETLCQFTLKKFLLLVYFLDRAKLTRLIDHDPCLFCKDSEYKASREILLEFSRNYLQGEGDITRHLSYYGYVVTHKQTALDEFDFAVSKLSTALRCGVRLARVVELLTKNWALSRELRVPAISRLQKIHNTDVALKALKEHGIDVEGGGVNTRAIVDGHREKTLELLWRIIFHFQVEVMLNETQIKEEIEFLKKNLKLQRDLNAIESSLASNDGTLGLTRNSRDSIEPNMYFKSPRLSLLLHWCQAVCQFYVLKVENFTVSFSDGRALCYLVHHYHPSLLPVDDIHQDTTQTQYQRTESPTKSDLDDSFDGPWANSYSPSTGKPGEYERLLANERSNYKILYEKVRELGGIPMMIKSNEMSNTIPDEKVVIVYVAYLCSRLLDLRTETRAARTIQLRWRAYRLRHKQKERQIQIAAATKIQGAVRDFLTSRRHAKIMSTVIKMQALVRGKLARQSARRMRHEKLVKHQSEAAIVIQKQIKGFLERRRFQRLKSSALVIQSVVRGHLVRQSIERQHKAATLIQSHYQAWQLMQLARGRYIQMKSAAIMLQTAYRGHAARKLAKRMKAARIVQAQWRGYAARRAFSIKRYSAMTIQAWFRMCLVRQEYQEIHKSALVLQRHIRAYLIRKRERAAATTIQVHVRGFLLRQRVKKMNQCALCIQRNFRAYIEKKHYQQLKHAALVLQTYWKATIAARKETRQFQIQRGACITVQAWFRGCIVRKQIHKMCVAATCIQRNYRAHRDFAKYQQMKRATMVLQMYWRSTLVARNETKQYQITRGAAITVQAWVRGFLVRQHIKKQHAAAVCIQANYKSHMASISYQKTRQAVLTIQTYWRATQKTKQEMEDYHKIRQAVITIQSWVRGHKVRQNIVKMNAAATCIQCNFRARRDYVTYQKLRQSAVTIQTYLRATLQARREVLIYQIRRGACISIQALVRGYQARQRIQKMHSAATCLQSNFRRYHAYNRYQSMRKAASTLQIYWRATLSGREQKMAFVEKKNAAITLQAAFRGRQARQLARRERAARTIQAVFMMHKARRAFLEKRHGAIKIQTVYRAHRAQQSYMRLKCSAMVIQKYYRGLLLMRQTQANFAHSLDCVVKIQSTFRMFVTRRAYVQKQKAVVKIQAMYRAHKACKEFKSLKQAVIIIQRFYRGLLLTRHANERFVNAKKSATVIQSYYRMHVQRREYRRLKQAVIVLQAYARGKAVSKEYNRMKRAAVVIQTRYRAKLAACQEQLLYQYTRGAVISIQSYYRMHVQRREYLRMKQAAIVLQAYARGKAVRNEYKRMEQAAVVIQTRYRAKLVACQEQLLYQYTRGAVITIQAVYRGYRVRKQQRQIRESVKVLQVYWRATLQAKYVKKEYQTAKRACVTIQAAVRGFIVRQHVQKMHVAATCIQANYRAHRESCHYQKLKEGAICLQKYWRANLKMKQERVSYQNTKRSCITIQAFARGFLVRHQIKKMNAAAVCIQKTYRAYYEQKHYQQLKQSCVVLQKYWRATLYARLQAKEYQTTVHAVITIQALVRGYLVRQHVREMNQAAICIQTNFRCYMARKSFLRHKQAAQTIQLYWRSTLVAKKQTMVYQITRGACITIQAWVRGIMLRQQVQKMHLAATCIQTNYRAHHESCQYQKLKQATICLQKYWRATLDARQQTKDYQITRGAIITIQAVARGFLVRQQVKKMNQAAVCIQSNFRCYMARKSFLRHKNAAQTIQLYWRSTLITKKKTKVYQITRGACITIQAWFRGITVRRQVQKMHLAATCIQANYRAHYESCQYHKLKQGAICLQKYWRATLDARQQTKDYQTTRSSIITIQALVRGYLARQQVKEMNQAALCIQSNFRCYMARNSFLRHKQAAQTIQLYWRSTLVAKKQRKVYQITRGACITIQAWMRGIMVRQQVQKMHLAATCIQANYRAHRESCQYHKLKQTTICLQKYWRATLDARQQTRQYQVTRGAIITIQALVRGYLVRQQVREMNEAAICIQCNFRCYMARKSFLRHKNAAETIQLYWRSTLIAKKQTQTYQITRGACITIQALVRGFLVRQQVQKMHLAAVCIQTNYRAHKDYSQYQCLKKSAVVLQMYWRLTLKARQLTRQYQVTRGAIITIQAWARGMVARRRITEMHRAATCIQSNYRAYRDQTQYQKIKWAAVTLQKYWRGVVRSKEEMKQYQITRGAVISIQAWARGMIVRRRISEMHSAATCLQSNYRTYRDYTRYQKIKHAALTLQKYWRGAVKGKEEMKQYQITRGAIITIQAWARGMIVRRRVAEMHRAATCIQSNYRAYRDYTRYQNLKRAAMILQKYWRGVVKGKEEVKQYQVTRGAIITIQAWARGMIIRRRVAEMNCAATCIQSNYRAYRDHTQYQKIKWAAVTLQKYWRGVVKGKEEMKQYQVTRGAVITMQAAVRGFLVRQELRKQEMAATCIQSNYRTYVALKSYQQTKRAAIVLQRYWRATLLSRKLRGEYVETKQSCIMIQAHIRGFLARQQVGKMHNAATCIQACYRAYVAHKNFKLVKQAVKTLQTYLRATLCAKEHRRAYQYTRGAVITLQAAFRGRQARKHVRQIRASITIQAAYRGYVQQKEYQSIRRSAIVLQAVFRGHQTRVKLAERRREWSAALCIQKAYRGFVARKELEATRQARLVTVHRFAAAVFHHISAIKLQRVYRNYCIMKIARQRMQSIVYIQRWWRAKLQCLHFTKLRRGITLLQRAVRHHQKVRNSAAIVLQSYVRVWLAKQYVIKMKTSALRIQCMWRGHKVRRANKSKKVAAARAKCIAANAAATEEKKLCNRTTSALDFLLQYKNLSYILEALINLDVATRLSPICCERLVEGKAVPVLYKLIRSCNRSEASKEVIKYSVSILLNLVKYHKTTEAVFDGPESIATILDLMQMYREKGTLIFCQTCLLLSTLCHDKSIAKAIQNIPNVTEKIKSIHRLTERKHKIDNKRAVAKQRTRLGSSFLNSSSMNKSCLNISVVPGTNLKRRRVEPDWVLGHDRMREIQDPIHAIKFLMDSLGLLHK